MSGQASTRTPAVADRVDASVVVTTYNRARLLEELLTGLAGQRTPARLRWELIVIDNNSRDETRAVVRRSSARLPVPVRYVFEPTQGMSHARNRGVRESRGEVVGILDDDVLPGSDWVSILVGGMARWGADGIGGRILPRWEAPPPPWLVASRPLQRYCFALMDHGQHQELSYPVRSEGQIWGSNMGFRRRLFEEIGYFETDHGRAGRKLYRGAEEQLFVERALRMGRRMVYDPSLTVVHRIGADRMRKPYLRKFFFEHGEGEALFDTTAHPVRLLGAPRWAYAMTLHRLRQWVTHSLWRRADAFERELSLLYECGKLWGYWKGYSSAANGRRPR